MSMTWIVSGGLSPQPLLNFHDVVGVQLDIDTIGDFLTSVGA